VVVHTTEGTLNRHDLEDEITHFLQGQIEDGKLDAQGMASQFAQYGLMLPSDFIKEMEGRSDQSIADGIETNPPAPPRAMSKLYEQTDDRTVTGGER